MSVPTAVPETAEPILVHGLCLAIRMLSKHMLFVDILTSSYRSPPAADVQVTPNSKFAAPYLTCIIKEGSYGGCDDLQTLKNALRLGDLVIAHGELDASGLLVSQLQVECVWQGPDKFTVPSGYVTWWSGMFRQRKGARPASGTEGSNTPASRQEVCKGYLHTKHCERGEACTFLHLKGEERKMYLASFLQTRGNARQASAQQQGFSVHSPDVVAKRRRAQVLATWLVQTFGKERLNQGSGVLDVAGGRGALSFELVVVHGVKCTLVEPRPFKLSKYQHQQLSTRQGANTSTASVDCTPDAAVRVQQIHLGRVLPQLFHIQDLFTEALWGPAAAAPAARPTQWGHTELLAHCSCVIGMHPDQATDQIINFANACSPCRPFVILPCCVFPTQFPHRRLSPISAAAVNPPPEFQSEDGDEGMWQEPPGLVNPHITAQGQDKSGSVTSFAQLVAWLLQEGGPSAQRINLAFQGANVAVYRT